MIRYIIGDATQPQGEDKKLIIHCCNDIGVWGAGFVTALSKRWKQPEQSYREWMSDRTDGYTQLGQVQFCPTTDPDIRVANIIGQHRVGEDENGNSPVRYDALEQGFQTVARYAMEYDASVHGPRLGSGLAGGDWKRIESLLEHEIVSKGISVTIYDLPSRK